MYGIQRVNKKIISKNVYEFARNVMEGFRFIRKINALEMKYDIKKRTKGIKKGII